MDCQDNAGERKVGRRRPRLAVVRFTNALKRPLIRLALFVVLAPFWLWGVFAFIYGSWSNTISLPLALLYGLAHIAAVGFVKPLKRMIPVCVVLFLIPLAAFHLMQPSNTQDWQPNVAKLPYAEINGDDITIHNVRNCIYESETNYTAVFETRHYQLSKLRTGDMFLVDWGLHKVAHTMLSFGFDDGQYLCFSIETRKKEGDAYSAFKGLFRQYEVIFIAGDERDLIRLRTNFRTSETARLYRMTKAPQQTLQATFLDYLDKINALEKQPQWYNAVTDNCMVGFFQIARKHSRFGHLGWHWSVILNGYADYYAYQADMLDTSLPFETLKERSIINDKAVAAGDSPDFSALIRNGLPGINTD